MPSTDTKSMSTAGTKTECRCNCGYRCGGPGTCTDPDCWIGGSDGKEHFVRDCDHKWNGPMKPHYSNREDGTTYESGGSVTCSGCGMDAMSHDCAVGP